MRSNILLRSIGAIALGAVALFPVTAQAPELAMLGGLTAGAWTLRDRESGQTDRICVRTGRELIQIRHRQPGCSQFVIEDTSNEVAVQYTCRGNGYGRTTIRRESARLVQVRSQGTHGGTPFSIDGEARYVGAC